MAVPDYETLMRPALQAVAAGEPMTTKALRETVAGQLRLNPEDRAETIPSGAQPVFDNRIGWATTYLVQAGLLVRRSGVWSRSPSVAGVVGVTVGVVFGALGGWWGERPDGAWIPQESLEVPFFGEVLALSVGGLPHPMFSSRLAVVQAIVGIAGASLLGWRRGWWRAVALTAAVAGAIGLVEVATGFPTRLIW